MTRFFLPEGKPKLKQSSWVAIAICTIIVIIRITLQPNQSSDEIGISLLPYLNDEHNHKVTHSSKKRPIIHCYYQNVDYNIALKNNPNLRTWADMWSDIGWDPVLLSLDDARKHPDFAKHVAEGMDISHPRHARYLAMSVVPNGGWYAENNVYPLYPILPTDKKSLPNNGKFTGHDRHVPSLLTGSQKEWIRMSHLLLSHPIEEDMLALHDLHIQDEKSYVYENNVISYRVLSNNKKNLEVPKLCEVTKGKRAIRISPEDIGDMLKESGQSYSEFTRSFMSKWRTCCFVDRPII